MATDLREQGPPIVEDLYEHCYHYEFHQAVKLLELANPGASPLGCLSIPSGEVISIRSRVEYSYPSSDLFSLEKRAANQAHSLPATLKVNFMGIAGPNGPLPMPFSERLMERARAGDTAFRDFLDIFNHRIISIFHRIRKKYWVGLDTRAPDDTEFARILFSILGIGSPHLQNRLAVPDRGLLYYAGLLWKMPRCAVGLEVFLSHYFDVKVKVEQFCGRWLPIEVSQQTKIGRQGHFQSLGQGAAIGSRFWDTKSLINIHVGPLDDNQFRRFLPDGGTPFKALCELVRFYLGKEHSFEITLVMKASDVEASVLAKQTTLGWTSWLKTHPFTQDDDQVMLKIQETS
jgi:type VI secretion system protein ImpH